MAPRPERGTHDGEHSPWELDLRDDPRLKALYLDNESYDGYRRDQDVFGPGVTTEDNLAVIVDYARGATLSYALNAHSPWEGYRIAVNGDEGRAELEVVERAAVLTDADGKVVVDPSAVAGVLLADRRRAADPATPLGGGPGRQDRRRRRRSRWRRRAAARRCLPRRREMTGWNEPSDWVDGIRSIAVGMAGNESLRTGLPVKIADLDLGVDLSRWS